MTESSSGTHDTPASLKEALHLAIDTLPPQSSSFGQLSAGLVLEAINRLQFKGFSQDDQLAAILSTLPRQESFRLAPSYLIGDVDAVSNLWKLFVMHLGYQSSSDQPSVATIGTAISEAPARARSIISVFLTVANEHCCRSMSADIPNIVCKPYLQNMLAIAQALEKTTVDTTADDLMDSVTAAIDKVHLTDELTPERTWVWLVQAHKDLALPVAREVISGLKRVTRKQWLIKGELPNGTSQEPMFFVRNEHGRDGNEGVVDRLMASLAARFGKLCTIRKVRYSEKLSEVQWSRQAVSSWMTGMAYQAARERLLTSTRADPLEAIVDIDDLSTANDQLKFYKMLMNLGVGDNGVRILKEDTVKNLLAKSTRPKGMGGYSLGLSAPEVDKEDSWFGHGGAWGTNCSVNWHRKELKLWVVQLCGQPRPWDKARGEAEKKFFQYVIDNSGADAYTGRVK